MVLQRVLGQLCAGPAGKPAQQCTSGWTQRKCCPAAQPTRAQEKPKPQFQGPLTQPEPQPQSFLQAFPPQCVQQVTVA